MSLYGGAGLLALAIVGLILSERRWLKILCGVYIGLYVAVNVHALLVGDLGVKDLAFPGTFALFGLFVAGVKKTFSKW